MQGHGHRKRARADVSHTVTSVLRRAEELAAAADARDDPIAAARLPVLVQATRLKLGLDAAVSEIAAQDVAFRFSLLLHIADGSSRVAAGAVESVVRETVTELSDRAHEKVAGLGLWGGMTPREAGYESLPAPYRAMALERVIRAGRPSALEEAQAWIIEMLPAGSGRDTVNAALVQSRCPSDGAAMPEPWLPILAEIGAPARRAQGLLELAVLIGSDSDPTALVAAATEAYEETSMDGVLWRGQPAAALGGAAARTDPLLSEELLSHAWDAFKGAPYPEKRASAFQALLMAETQRGATHWRRTLETLARDGPLKAHPRRWADLVFDAGSLSRFVRVASSERRAEALAAVAGLIDRITYPATKALAHAAFAEAFSRTTGPPPAHLFDNVRAVLRVTQDARERARILPRVSRLCGRADLDMAAQLVSMGRSAHERVIWMLALAEVAADRDAPAEAQPQP